MQQSKRGVEKYIVPLSEFAAIPVLAADLDATTENLMGASLLLIGN